MPAYWKVALTQPELFTIQAAAAVELDLAQQPRVEAMLKLSPIPMAESHIPDEIDQRLSWRYPHEMASQLLSKTSVTELKRLGDTQGAAEFNEDKRAIDIIGIDAALMANHKSANRMLFRRPRFIERKQLSAAERGTVYHAVMQQLPLRDGLTASDIQQTVDRMLALHLLSREQYEAVDCQVIMAFIVSAIGQRLLRSGRVLREAPFSFGLKAGDIYPFAEGSTLKETVLIQGVIDCLFEDERGLVLLDYKTDAVRPVDVPHLRARYRVQIELYSKAVEHIFKKPVTEKYLYFFDGTHLVSV
jgi:ATP-dependent helicase/nuclease subunit A